MADEAAAPGGVAGARAAPGLFARLRGRFRPRIATILLIVNVTIVLLPLGSIFFLRIYENQLIQETERELIAQAAFIAAAYERDLTAHPGFVAKRYIDSARLRAVAAPALGAVAPAPAARAALDSAEVLEERALAPRPPPPPLELGPDDPGYRPQDPTIDLFREPTLPARPDGQPAGAPDPLATEIGAALTPLLARAQQTTLAGMRLLDPAGTVIAGQAEIGVSFAHVREVKEALDGAYASVLRYRALEGAPPELASISRGTGVRVFIAYPVAMEPGQVLGVVYLSRTPKSILKHLYGEREKVVLAALLMLGLAAGLAWLTSRTISRPVDALLARMRRIVAGDRAALAPVQRSGTREVAELAEGLSRMATALNDRADYIRSFARHVSHEFKTPLAGIRGAAELMADHDDSITREERRRFLDNIDRDAVRLQALLARLLTLARAEHAAPPPGPLALAPALERLAEGHRAAGLEIAVALPAGLSARVSEEALSILLDNLAQNALQHGAGRLEVSAEPAEEGIVALLFADDGRGVSPANRARVFEHFFTTRRAEGGTGLGLAIVRAVLQAQGGEIALMEGRPDGGRGTAFRVRLRA